MQKIQILKYIVVFGMAASGHLTKNPTSMEELDLNDELQPDNCGEENCPYCELVEFLALDSEEENAA